MTLNSYIENLQKFLKDNPKAGDMKVIYATDEEGNAYKPLDYSPSLAEVYDFNQRWLEVTHDNNNPNAVIIN